jgi:hypothetical protein
MMTRTIVPRLQCGADALRERRRVLGLALPYHQHFVTGCAQRSYLPRITFPIALEFCAPESRITFRRRG